MKSLVTTLLLACAAASAAAADLELFNLKLADASAEQVRAAAVNAGARPTGSKGAVVRLDASRIGLPGAQTLELTAIGGKVMTAQYFFGKNPYATDETMRKMLLAKYGPPRELATSAFGNREGFGARYVADGSYVWDFDRDMQLVYRKEFFGEVYLSYVNKKLLAAVEAAVKAGEEGSARDKANKNSKVF